MVECCVVNEHSIRKQEHSHHFVEALNGILLQKLGCSTLFTWHLDKFSFQEGLGHAALAV